MNHNTQQTKKTPERYQPTLRECQQAAIALLAAQGLELDAFGLAVTERVVAGELTVDQAVQIVIDDINKNKK